jgi:ribonuclease HI
MTKNKQYYVVIQGHRPGLYYRWFGEEGAAEQVDGLADAVYKGFYTLQEAVDWLRELHAETIPGLAPDLVELLGLPAERRRREDPSALLKAGKVVIYTDGGVLYDPGSGGYGVVLRYKEHRKELSGGFRRTTKNRMELLACIEGLKALRLRCSVVLYSNSRYVVHGMTKGWAEQWQAKGWKLEDDADVKNADLWRQLVSLCQEHDVELRWIRGHVGNVDIETCDQLAMAAARRPNLPVDTVYETTSARRL